MDEIHRQDVKQLLFDNRYLIENKRNLFEKYKQMTELISNIQSEIDKISEQNDEDDDGNGDKETESTSMVDFEDFNKWARNEATKDLANFKI